MCSVPRPSALRAGLTWARHFPCIVTTSVCVFLAIVCWMQVSSSSGPTFLLHIIPSHGGLNPSDAHTQKSKYTSRAGEGPGLQVFPGSVPQVAEVRGVSPEEGPEGCLPCNNDSLAVEPAVASWCRKLLRTCFVPITV